MCQSIQNETEIIYTWVRSGIIQNNLCELGTGSWGDKEKMQLLLKNCIRVLCKMARNRIILHGSCLGTKLLSTHDTFLTRNIETHTDTVCAGIQHSANAEFTLQLKRELYLTHRRCRFIATYGGNWIRVSSMLCWSGFITYPRSIREEDLNGRDQMIQDSGFCESARTSNSRIESNFGDDSEA